MTHATYRIFIERFRNVPELRLILRLQHLILVNLLLIRMLEVKVLRIVLIRTVDAAITLGGSIAIFGFAAMVPGRLDHLRLVQSDIAAVAWADGLADAKVPPSSCSGRDTVSMP